LFFFLKLFQKKTFFFTINARLVFNLKPISSSHLHSGIDWDSFICFFQCLAAFLLIFHLFFLGNLDYRCCTRIIDEHNFVCHQTATCYIVCYLFAGLLSLSIGNIIIIVCIVVFNNRYTLTTGVIAGALQARYLNNWIIFKTHFLKLLVRKCWSFPFVLSISWSLFRLGIITHIVRIILVLL